MLPGLIFQAALFTSISWPWLSLRVARIRRIQTLIVFAGIDWVHV
jgi:hypothetical protein